MSKPVLIHAIPGRARFDLRGINRNSDDSEGATKWLARIEGVHSVNHSPISGRIIVHYDPRVVSLAQIIDGWPCDDQNLVSAATEMHQPQSIPLGLVASVGSLVALSAKQIVAGRSLLSVDPVLFGASGVLAVIAGYSGQNGPIVRKFPATGVLLQTGALVLGVLRENLVVLGALSLLQYLNWQRTVRGMPAHSDIPMQPEVMTYFSKASRRGLLFSTIAFALTGNVLFGLGVLLAANPRPAVASAEYAWRQTEYRFREKGIVVPQNGTLHSLAKTERVIFADADMLFRLGDERLAWIANEGANQPFSWELLTDALSHMVSSSPVQEQGGLTFAVGENAVYVGDAAFMRAAVVDVGPLELQAKRWRKNGRLVQYVAYRSPLGETSCLGLIVGPVPMFRPECLDFVTAARRHGLMIAVAGNSYQISGEWLRHLGIEVVDPAAGAKRIAVWQNESANTLAVINGEAPEDKLAPTLRGLPWIDIGQIATFSNSVAAAKGIHRMVNEHLRITRAWNWLGVFLVLPFTPGGVLVANIVSDSLSLLFISRAKRVSERLTA